MKTEYNKPDCLIFAKGDTWLSARLDLDPDGTKVSFDLCSGGGLPLLTPKNIGTLTNWLAKAKRQIRATNKLRQQTDSDRLDNS